MQITQAGGDYLLAVKENQPSLLDDIRLFFNDEAERPGLDYHQTSDADHGRIEVRRHWLSNDVAWLDESHNWPGLAAIAMVGASRET